LIRSFFFGLEELETIHFLTFFKFVYLYRKVRHKNVVQFIGACTKPPSLCIVTGTISSPPVLKSIADHLQNFKKGTSC
jgi:hypothetical protein